MEPTLDDIRKKLYVCIGCQKNYSEVKKLIQFHTFINICNECVEQCVKQIEEDDERLKMEEGGKL